MKYLEDICRVQVKFSEIDSMQRVWHGAYITYFEDGRESFGRHYPGIGYADMQRSGIYAPIYDIHIKYCAPLVMNDVVIVHTHYIYKPVHGLITAMKSTVSMTMCCVPQETPSSCSSILRDN